MPQLPTLSKSIHAWRLVPLGLVGIMFGCGVWLQAHVHLNHDVAWITHSAGWLLQGRHFGRDIIDVNPPLIWFISIPAAWLVNIGLSTEADAIRLYVWALCAASLTICHRLLARRDTGTRIESMALLAGAAFAMAILPGAAFAQREYLAFVLGLPYCLLVANRIEVSRIEERVASARGLAVICGALAGIAFGFKPWLLAVPLLLELLYLAKARKLRNVLRTETATLATVLLVYLVAVLVFAWDYLVRVVPMGIATYWAYDVPGTPWFHWRAAVIPLLAALVCLGIARSLCAQAQALMVAFAGFSLSNWAQNKGFAYHAYPALAVAVTLFVYSIPVAAKTLLRAQWRIGNWLKVSMVACLIVAALNLLRLWSDPVNVWFAKFNMRTGEIGMFRSKLIAMINASVPRGDYVYAFSSHPFPAFPTLSYTAAEWGSPMVGQFAIPAFLARDRVKDPTRLAALDRAVQAQREQVITDFEQHPPSLVLVETQQNRLGMAGRNFDDIEFYSSDPRFATIWSQYVETQSIDTLRIFVRRHELN